jgi:hypothetical protein
LGCIYKREAEEDNDIRMQELEFVSSRPSTHFPASLSACGGSSLIGLPSPRLPEEATDKDHGFDRHIFGILMTFGVDGQPIGEGAVCSIYYLVRGISILEQ